MCVQVFVLRVSEIRKSTMCFGDVFFSKRISRSTTMRRRRALAPTSPWDIGARHYWAYGPPANFFLGETENGCLFQDTCLY